jgi:hypothetical protein
MRLKSEKKMGVMGRGAQKIIIILSNFSSSPSLYFIIYGYFLKVYNKI